MNTSFGVTDELGSYSNDVQACCDMFGPVDLPALMDAEAKRYDGPAFR